MPDTNGDNCLLITPCYFLNKLTSCPLPMDTRKNISICKPLDILFTDQKKLSWYFPFQMHSLA